MVVGVLAVVDEGPLEGDGVVVLVCLAGEDQVLLQGGAVQRVHAEGGVHPWGNVNIIIFRYIS